MERYFEYEDIEYLLANELSENNEYFLRILNAYASSFKDEQKREIYIELIKGIHNNLEDYFREEFIQNMSYWLIENKDLNDLASLYKMTLELSENEYLDNELRDTFFEEQDIHAFSDLWEEMDSDLRTNGIDANIYLLKDLLEIHDTESYIKLNAYGRAEEIYSINDEFQDWLATKKIDDLLVNYPYDLDDYLKEKQTEGLVL
ncbi:Hypothetical protein MAU_2920 [Metamycoplasma auris 15026]|uniref:Uncharacterized protein n=1 Tax=Metamycoplasma auris 15026 TaxID=1188233 RepID=N9V066_9BACT|nr:hypothetical protein [Metamycoplasma auris]ENY68807.1 Hypothetical protein MAU_2920 [Metamycoplasma auris 15026]